MATFTTRCKRLSFGAASLILLLSAASLFAGCDDRQVDVVRPASGTVSDSPPPATAPTPTAPPLQPARPAAAAGRPATFADAVEEARPAVVNIYTRTRVRTNRFRVEPFRGLVPEERIGESLGSGFIVDEAGFVLTNYHVVKGATQIEVRLFDERVFAATLVGEDPKTDVALLKIVDARDLPAVRFADSDALRVGDWVIAIGNPLGLTSTVTAGIVSATGRHRLPLGDMAYQDFIQTDASINPGNSGGPLVDGQGRVVGINTAVNQAAQGIGFAIPINMIREILPKLKEGGRVERSWLGLYIDPVPSRLRTELGIAEDAGGALVTRVVPGGPADRAHLRQGDVILSLAGSPVADADELAWLAGNVGVGKEVAVEVQRGDERIETRVTMGAQPE